MSLVSGIWHLVSGIWHLVSGILFHAHSHLSHLLRSHRSGAASVAHPPPTSYTAGLPHYPLPHLSHSHAFHASHASHALRRDLTSGCVNKKSCQSTWLARKYICFPKDPFAFSVIQKTLPGKVFESRIYSISEKGYL